MGGDKGMRWIQRGPWLIGSSISGFPGLLVEYSFFFVGQSEASPKSFGGCSHLAC